MIQMKARYSANSFATSPRMAEISQVITRDRSGILFILFSIICSSSQHLLTIESANFKEVLGFSQKYWTHEKKAMGYVRCVQYCLPHDWCRAASYDRADKLCRFSTSFDHNQLIQIKEESKWVVYVDLEDKEELVYKICAENNQKVGGMWSGSTFHDTSERSQHSLTGKCRKHYKSPIVEKWKTLDVYEVRIAFVQNGTQTSVTFNGSGSDKMNWFAAERMIKSPWPDQANITSTKMHYHEKRHKYWYVREKGESCRTEKGWFAVLDKEPTNATAMCDWERNKVKKSKKSYPMILFSNRNSTPMDRFVKECQDTETGLNYTGFRNVLPDGTPCQRWDATEPQNPSFEFKNISYFPKDSSFKEVGNFCRNPGEAEENGVWCYTMNKHQRWDSCDVPKCLKAEDVIYRQSDLIEADYFIILVKKRTLVEIVS